MSGEQRKAALATFQKTNAEGGPRVLLVSTRAGGAGLNLTQANHVFRACAAPGGRRNSVHRALTIDPARPLPQ
jgi:hypothetical protein